MRKTLAITATALAMTLATTPLAARDAEERSAEAFAELTEGRVAGEPQSCITTVGSSNRIRVEEHLGIVYERGDTIWIARATNPRDLGPWDVPIIDRYGSQLCRMDVIRTVDRSSGFFTGVVFLEDFVPYTRVDG